MMEKVSVNGSSTHPIFSYLKRQDYGNLLGVIKWNFTKFLIDKNGRPVNRYEPTFAAGKMESRIKELLTEKPTADPAAPVSEDKKDSAL